jgi:hypothetical protein
VRAGGCTSQRYQPQADRLALQAPWHPRLLHMDVCESAGMLQQSKRLTGDISGVSQCSVDFRHMELTGICRLTEPICHGIWPYEQRTCQSRWGGFSDQHIGRLRCVKRPANAQWSDFIQRAENIHGREACCALLPHCPIVPATCYYLLYIPNIIKVYVGHGHLRKDFLKSLSQALGQIL